MLRARPNRLSSLLLSLLLVLGGSTAQARYVPPYYEPQLIRAEKIDLRAFDPVVPFSSGGTLSAIDDALREAGVPSILRDAVRLALSTAGEGAGIPQYPLRLSSFLSYECNHFGGDNNIGAFFCAASNLYNTAYGYISNLGVRHANIANRIYGDFLRKLGQSVYDAVVSAATGADWLKSAAKAMDDVRTWLDSTMAAYYQTLETAGYAVVDAFIAEVFGPSDAQTVNYGDKPGTTLKGDADKGKPPADTGEAEGNAQTRITAGSKAEGQVTAIGNTMTASNPQAAEAQVKEARRRAEAAAVKQAADDALKTALNVERNLPKAPVQLPGNPAKEMAERREQLAAAISDRQVLEIIGDIILSDGLYRRAEAEAILRALSTQAEIGVQTFKTLALVAKATAAQYEERMAPAKEAVRSAYEATVEEASKTTAQLRQVLCLQTVYSPGAVVGAPDPSVSSDPCAKLYTPPDIASIQSAFAGYVNF